MLPIAYPLSLGLASYACDLGGVTVETYNAVWGRPLRKFTVSLVSHATGLQAYFEWWVRLGRFHEQAADTD